MKSQQRRAEETVTIVAGLLLFQWSPLSAQSRS